MMDLQMDWAKTICMSQRGRCNDGFFKEPLKVLLCLFLIDAISSSIFCPVDLAKASAVAQ